MKSNKTLLLLVLLIQVGCTKKSSEPLISKWAQKTEENNVVERALASGQEGQCLKDVFSVDTLKKEIRELEKKYAEGEKVRGQWKHIDLETLPVPQANFLKTYGDQIGDLSNPNSIDYSFCTDLPCIFNKIYGKEEHVAGHVHYLWYLRFGNMLSLDNLVPQQDSRFAGSYNGRQRPLQDYLYNEQELYALWRLSLMLKAPHTTLKYLKEVQRIPRGENFEGADFKGACGLAYSQGWILLTDGCLTVNRNQDQGYLYQAVTHELTHHVDFQEGRGTRAFYRSHKQDYLDLAGMFLTEFVDEKGQAQRKWNHQPDIKLMTPYAGTSPQENFAESISVFRVDGDNAKEKVTEDHYNFVSKNYYQDRYFEKEVLMKNWIQEYSADIGKAAFTGLVDCSKKSLSLKSATVSKCLDERSSEISDSIRARVTVREPDGCLAFNGYSLERKWDLHMKDHLQKTYDRHFEMYKNDKEYLARIQQYDKEIADRRIARNAYISCYKERQEERCYNQEVLKNAPQDIQEMAEMYLAYHPYEKVRDETKQYYEIFVASHLERVREEADFAWEGCLNLPHNDEQSPSGGLFQVSDGYMISSFYNCLNTSVPLAVKGVIANLSVDGFKVEHEKEEQILSELVQPHVLKMLNEKYLVERDLELKSANDFIAQDKGEIRKALLARLDWVKSIVDPSELMASCKREAYKHISFRPLYHLKSTLFSAYLEKSACFNVSETNEFNKWLEVSQDQFHEDILMGLEDKMVTLAVARAQECVRLYPINSIIQRIRYWKSREACLLEQWPKLERRAVESMMQEPVVVKLKIPTEFLQRGIEDGRERLQSRVIQDHLGQRTSLFYSLQEIGF